MRCRRISVLVTFLAVSTGCSRGSVGVQPPPTLPDGIQPVDTGRISGKTSKRVASMTDAEFANFVHTQVTWVDGHVRARCGGALCLVGLTKVPVAINASYNSHRVDPRSVPSPSVVVQRVINNGGGTTRDGYHFRPQPFEYYFEVLPPQRPPGPATYLLWELDPQGHKTAVPTQKQVFFPCDDHASSGVDEADFANCGDKWKLNVSRASFIPTGLTNLLSAVLGLDFAINAPAWISCPSGCCTNAAL